MDTVFAFFLPQLVGTNYKKKKTGKKKPEKTYQKITPIIRCTFSGIEAQQFGQKFEGAELDFIRLEAK